MVRFENLADRFDAQSKEVSYINMNKFAEGLYTEVNSGMKPQSVLIEEISLSGNQLLSNLT